MRSRLVILDANIIIEAFKLDFWNSLISSYVIHIPSIVLHSEVYYYQDKDGNNVSIDLFTHIKSKKVVEVAASATEIMDLDKKVTPYFMDCIDDGEKEALALLLTGRFEECLYCTGDASAIKALSSLNLGSYGISLEELLIEVGQQKKLPNQSYSKIAFNLKKAQGIQEQSILLKK